jgi:hypothetical protein
MNPETRVLINLASRPARNRRLFLSACGFFAVLIAVFLFLSGSAWVNYGVKKKSLREQTGETERLSREARSEESRLEAEIQSAAKALGTKVGIINGIILRKTFSWTDLFARLEESLPDPSFIRTFAPSIDADSTLILKIQVVSRSLDDLVRLINNLLARGFRDIRVTNESTDPMGRNLAEISLTYERIL